MLKQELRKIYKKKRVELTATERNKLDDLLLIQLQNLAFGNSIEVLLSYWPLVQHCEMNTLLYTRYLETAIPGLKVTFPLVNLETKEMQAILVHDETDFVENEYGIPEPEEGDEISAEEIDLVFVPLLAFDKKGFRVGYGKGFYDRFLKKCREDVISVGFSYFEPVDAIEDKNQFDVPLNYCITPFKIYEF
ncbi:5-formyltetrahydrofolate cyclo-ligase [Segetibacter sp.]|jgi:5-formyltetrahydrofolate cyclo-ligase|uniref:5-formyltetrahydrofolate cyclo-ligase n=1 Tax=Segetibacter sp. TaxID=2231182 RepID=UPI002629773A|nr:5-formyltetrahydrofolate cyclo-ligase [Segetibacter sp.]MCW3080178.1 5-formyltetrahydrofolate cyclo-ligase [Segetibacter sp.]